MLRAALNGNGRFAFKSPEYAVDHLVIGGGVIGLAIASRLAQKFPPRSTYLVERHAKAGEEISSRNSEVIHSGLYYPATSLKTRLSIRGRVLLYDHCLRQGVPHKRTGKLVVAKKEQIPYIEGLHQKSKTLEGLPTTLISGTRARELEPDLSRDIAGALWCPQTGIVDSHSLMQSLEQDIIDAEEGQLVYSTRVVRLDRADSGWVVQMATGETQSDSVLAHTLINACGLSSPLILNGILHPEARLSMFYAKGSYVKYRGAGLKNISHLIYPCPHIDDKHKSFHSLGTHLTVDLQGQIRFGPDLEWIDPPSVDDEEASEFWKKHLIPDESRLEQMHREVTEYLPDVRLDALVPDYVGVRPKLSGPQSGFQDFVFRTDYPMENERKNPMISLLGIESPGLTSSLAIAEHVVENVMNSE